MKQATNGIGWCVEIYDNGWDQWSRTYPSEILAEERLGYIQEADPDNEYRVYEVLKDASD